MPLYIYFDHMGGAGFIGLVACILTVAGMYKTYQKAGTNGIFCLLPVISQYAEYRFVWGNGFYGLLEYIPILGAFVYMKNCLQLAKVFGKDFGFGMGLIFLPFIFFPILGLGDAVYVGVQETEMHFEILDDLFQEKRKVQ